MAFFSTWSERTETALRMVVPYGLMSVLLILNVTALSYPFTGVIKAPLFLMGVYYWSIYRPTLIPVWLVFLAGCMIDLISGLPLLGMNALIFVITRWSIANQRRFFMSQNFFVIWFGFGLLNVMTQLAGWGIFGLFNFAWPPLTAIWFAAVLGAALFPIVSVALHLTHKVLPAPKVGSR